MTEFEWKEVTRKAARAAAEENLKSFKKMNKGSSKLMTDEEMVSKWTDDYIGRIRKEYPLEVFDEKTAFAIENYPASDMNAWLQSGQKNPRYPSPTQHAKNVEASKFLPLLVGNAEEGNDWYAMGWPMLQREGDKLGFDMSTKEGQSEFLGKLSEYQKMFDNAKNVEEMKQLRLGIPGTGIEFGPKGSAYVLGSLVSPTATKAIENSVATGEDLSGTKAASLALLDAGINSGMFAAPSMNLVKSAPILNGFIDAMAQGGLEGVRQVVGGAAGVETDYLTAPLAALAAGATRPAMSGTAQAALSGLQGKSAREFTRGFSRSTRAGNPVAAERAQLEKSIDYYNKQWTELMKKPGVKQLWEQEGSFNINPSLSQKKQLLEANLPANLSKFAKIPRNADGTLDKERIMYFYDHVDPRVSMNFHKEGFFKVNDERPDTRHYIIDNYTTPKGMVPGIYGGRSEQVMRGLMPSKMAEIEDRTPWGNAGMVLGELVGSAGGRVEPIIKINPLKPKFNSDYKESSWYKKLDENKKKIVDEAFKKKSEEEGI